MIPTSFVIRACFAALLMTAPVAASAANTALPAASVTPRDPAPVSEPSNIALFVLGLAGLLIGRRSSRTRRRPDDPPSE
jgi:hypothetical protein